MLEKILTISLLVFSVTTFGQSVKNDSLKSIDAVILQNKDCMFYSDLKKSIESNLSPAEIKKFNKIWTVALDFANWNNPDLRVGYEITCKRLRERYDLSDESVATLARLASYDWK